VCGGDDRCILDLPKHLACARHQPSRAILWQIPIDCFRGQSSLTVWANSVEKLRFFWVCFRKFGPLKPLNFQGAVDHVSAIESLNDLACCLHECFTESHANDIYDQSNFSNPRKSSFSTELALFSQ